MELKATDWLSSAYCNSILLESPSDPSITASKLIDDDLEE